MAVQFELEAIIAKMGLMLDLILEKLYTGNAEEKTSGISGVSDVIPILNRT